MIFPTSLKTMSKIIPSLAAGIFLSLLVLALPCDICYANSAPQIGTVTPSSGTIQINTTTNITTTYIDADGYADISTTYFLINSSISTGGLYAYYNTTANTIYLYGDAGSWIGGYAPGSANVIENSAVKIDLSKTTVSGSGTTLTINWNVTFKSTFIGTRNAYLYVYDKSSASAGWAQKATWTINAPPQIGTITPSSGTSNQNTAVSFTTTCIDPNGYQDVLYSYFIINTGLYSTGGLYAYYDANASKLYLANDSGSMTGGYAPGSASIIENSYVKLDCSKTTVSGSGTTQTIVWNVTFKSTLNGTKNCYLLDYDKSYVNTGWSQKGTWTVAATNQPPQLGTITPSNGAAFINTATNVTTTYIDPDGSTNIAYTYLLINSSLNAATCFYAYYNQSSNILYMANDSGSMIGGYAPGSANVIENSYVKLDCSKTTVSGSGTTLTVNWNITFKSTFTGSKNSYMYVSDKAGASVGFTQKGTWLISATNSAPIVGTITPSSGTIQVNTATNFATTCTDANGSSDIVYTYLLINSSITTVNGMYAYYNQNTNTIYMLNDAATSWVGGYTPGSSNTIENSYIKIDCSKTTVSGSGTTQTINWNITFKSPFTGTKNSYMYVSDKSGAGNGWTQNGSWTISSPDQPPSVGTVTPASGSSYAGTATNFTATYSDPKGYQNLSYVIFLVNSSVSYQNCLYVEYIASSNSLYLLNDTATAWFGPYAPGSANVMENSSAKIDCSKTTVSGSGTTLTVNWNVTFKAAFTGAKNTYLYATNKTYAAGFTQKGTWTINAAPTDNPPVITPTLISSAKGSTSNNMLGYSVISGKNISGNGTNDIVIAAPGLSTGSDIGRVYVYFGGDLTKNPDLTLTGSAAGGCFGYSMAVGDVNGDGYDDIIISEPYNNEAGTKAGKVYVYFGGPSLTNYPNATMKGQAVGDMFGYSVAACDLNNNKRDDIIIGAPYNTANTGKVYIYYGNQNINTTADITLSGVASGDLFGYSIASANNIDGNNDNGIVVGAPGLPTNTDRPGKAYLYLGGVTIKTTASLIMSGEANGDLFGTSVSAGDFNGDGCDDVIVGAEKNSTTATAAGKAYIYYGGKNMVNTASLTMTGEAANDRFGHLVASAGDVNGDGYSDVIVVSPNNTSGTGKAYLYFGRLTMTNTADATIKGEAVGDNFGSSVSSGGDIDKDGIDELLIGACNNSSNGTASGKAYLYNIVCSGQPTRTADALLDETEAKACKYFYDQILTTTAAYGLVKDTCYSSYSSTAATGFGLTALCIMANRSGSTANWTVTQAQASARVSATLDTLINIQSNQTSGEDYYGLEGFFFHFIGPDGKRDTSMNSEVSTVDTALLLAGVMTAGDYFSGSIQTKANTIFSNIIWSYFLDSSDEQYYMGWYPESGLIQQTWDRPSDETLLVSILAIASDPTNKDFQKAYYGFPRSQNSYASASQTFYVYNSYSGSLFTYIFAHCWYDFKKAGTDMPSNVQNARFAVPVNWWENSKTAAQANRQFCIDNITTYSSYSANDWGLSACVRPDRSYAGMNGAPPREYVAPDGGEPANDGTVPPYGAISTLPLMKDIETGGLSTNLAYQAMAHYYNDDYFRLWGPYGPRDSFNQLKKFSTSYTGINLGPIALMIENYRSSLIWNTFMADSRVSQVNHNLYTDTVAPVINQFSVTDLSSPTLGYAQSATVSVSINGYDAGGIAKWLITETNAQPSVADFNSKGVSSAPISYTIASTGNGLKNLYAWAIDKSNNISTFNTNAQAQIFLDTTPPAMGSVVLDGPYTASASQLHAKWAAQDPESGVIEYQYCITDGSTTGTVIRSWTSTGTVSEITATGLTLTQNHTYYFGVKARNGAGAWSITQYSTGITYNPLVPDVTCINPNDGAFSCASTTVSIYPTVNNPNGYSLQYQFTIKGTIKQAWTTLATYSWVATSSDVGSADIMIEVKDQYGTNYRTGTIYLVQPPVAPPLT